MADTGVCPKGDMADRASEEDEEAESGMGNCVGGVREFVREFVMEFMVELAEELVEFIEYSGKCTGDDDEEKLGL